MHNPSGHQHPPPGAERGVWGPLIPVRLMGSVLAPPANSIFARELEGLNTWGFSWSPSMNGSPSGSLT